MREYIINKLFSIYHAAGLNPNLDDIDKLAFTIQNDMLKQFDRENIVINIMGANNKIVRAPSDSVELKCNAISMKLDDPNVNYENALVSYADKYVYHNGVIYKDIKEDIGAYLMNNGYNSISFKLCNGDIMPAYSGNSVELFKKYFKLQVGFDKKKLMLISEEDVKETQRKLGKAYSKIDLQSDSFALLYCITKFTDVTSDDLVDFWCNLEGHDNLDALAKAKDISLLDLAYRIYMNTKAKQPISIEHMIEIGEYERDKYHLVYNSCRLRSGSFFSKDSKKVFGKFASKVLEEVINEEKERQDIN
ncbi:MAG: hypothetical protein J6A59_13865 [Lachnospiraceae bacterium]|nr:hypothetical protein [Lachnospiraceae bacterium]